MSLIVTIIILLILAGVSIRSLTGSKGLINQTKETKTAAEMQDIENQIDLVLVKAELKNNNVTMESVIKQLINAGLIDDESQVDQDTGDITIGDHVLEEKLADYVVTPEEKYYGNKNTVITSPTYFTFVVDESSGTATITGVKDEYAVKTYYNGEATAYTAVIKDGEKYVTEVVIPYEYVDENGKKYVVTGIGAAAFGLKDDSTWDSAISNVDYTFTSFLLPNTITTIGDSAFRCANLTSINIPSTVTSIGKYAFAECNGVPEMLNILNVTNLGRYAFFGCTDLKRITLEYLTTMGDHVFQDCTNLNTITIPNTLESINNYTFSGCINLSNIMLGDNIKSIGIQAFLGCTNLEEIDIPDSVTRIGNYAFTNCTKLNSVQLPNGMKFIGVAAFEGCISLKNINIPDGVTTIGTTAFRTCKNLESIDIPNSVTDIGQYTFDGCTNLSYVKLGNGMTSLKNSLFANCTSLTKLEISSSLINIENKVFSNCTSLSSITIPDSVESIGQYAFHKCTSLTNINIPKSVTTMGAVVFAGWTESQTINCEILESEKPETWDATWDYYNESTERKAQLNWGLSM